MNIITGKWKGAAPIPNHSLESLEERLEGDEKADFLCFLRRMLCWLPEKRATARELLFDPWLMHGLFKWKWRPLTPRMGRIISSLPADIYIWVKREWYSSIYIQRIRYDCSILRPSFWKWPLALCSLTPKTSTYHPRNIVYKIMDLSTRSFWLVTPVSGRSVCIGVLNTRTTFSFLWDFPIFISRVVSR